MSNYTLGEAHLQRFNRMLVWFERNVGRIERSLRGVGLRQKQILGGSSLTPCEAKDDLTPGFTDKDFYPMLSDMSDADTSADPIQVSDLRGGSTRAYGRDTMGTDEGGARGWYTTGPDGVNYLVKCKEIARMIRGTAQVDGSGNLTGMTSLASCDGGQLPYASGSAVTELTDSSTPALDVNGWTTQSGATVDAVWDESQTKYLVIDCSQCKT